MNKISIALIVLALSVLCSCSTQNATQLDAGNNRNSSSILVTTVWNTYATLYNFKLANPNATLGELYKGNDFEADMDHMEEAIAVTLGLFRPNVQGESTMGFAHFDDEIIDLD